MIRVAICLGAALLVAMAGCGSDGSSSSSRSPQESVVDVSLERQSTPPPTVAVDVPDVSLPDAIPTELVVTELQPGSGPESAEGDVVLVDYVGVRTDGGEQFDASYGKAPFPVVIGKSAVIDGWTQGLVGVQAGEQLQLDIPNDLAYRDAAQGDVIKAGDALTFVIDVCEVGKASPPPTTAELPADDEAVTELVIDDARVGDGAVLEDGQTPFVNLLLARGDTGETLQSTWDTGGPEEVRFGVADGTVPFLLDGLAGMQVGGRRVLTVPFAEAGFADATEEQLGFPVGTDLIVVADLVLIT
ncbi:MAG: FKBP-type peptidyl-prolyl cis-trans isomerase [Ilumatobacteraceae bacterium]